MVRVVCFVLVLAAAFAAWCGFGAGPAPVTGRPAEGPAAESAPQSTSANVVVGEARAPIADPPAAAPDVPEVPRATFVVVDRDGAAIAGARVRAFADGRTLAEAHTDGRGRAALVAVPAATPCVVDAFGYWPADAATADDVQVVLQPAAVLRGRVFDAEGAPCAGARAAFAGQDDAHHAISVADGWFELPWPSHAAHDLVVQHEGHAPHTTRAVRWLGDPTPPVMVHLVREAVVTGAVRSADGTALARVRVAAWPLPDTAVRRREANEHDLGPERPWGRAPAAASTTSDDAGTFRLQGLAARPHWIDVVDGGFTVRCIAPLAGGEVVVELRALPLAAVEALPTVLAPGTFVLAGGDFVRTAEARGLEPVRFADVPAGRYHLRAPGGDVTLVLQAGERRTVIWPAPGDAPGSVHGRAFRGGTVAAGVEVLLLPQGAGAAPRRATVRDDGSFVFGEVPPGSYVVQLDGRPAEAVACEVVAGGAPVVVIDAQ
jgi:hypothetical protein